MNEQNKQLIWLWDRSDGDEKVRIRNSIINSKDIDALIWLWERSDGDYKVRIRKALIETKNFEALKWLWERSDGDYKVRIRNAIIETKNHEALKWLWERSDGDYKVKIRNAMLFSNDELNTNYFSNEGSKNLNDISYEFDVFISHASEDKEDVARPLALALENKNIRIWFDEFTLKLGDSLRRSIDKGLAVSKYGVVILSNSFFSKEWPQKELDALVAREDGKQKVILPVWHNIQKRDILKYSPLLADKLAVSTEMGIDYVVNEIYNAII